MLYTVHKIDAAVDQIDWAIRLLIDEHAFIPAISLAGAAEELLGKAVGERAAFKQLMETLPEKYGLDSKIVSQDHLNRARNWLKHWNLETEPPTAEFELEEEATQLIVRALANLLAFDRSLPSQGLRFFEWLGNRKAPGAGA